MTTRILKIAVVKENQTKSESGSSGLFDKKGKYAKLLKNSAVRNFKPTLTDSISPFDQALTHHCLISFTFRSFLSELQ